MDRLAGIRLDLLKFRDNEMSNKVKVKELLKNKQIIIVLNRTV